MSLPRWSACCFILLFFACCGVNCEGGAAGHELKALSRRAGAHFAVVRTLKSTAENDALDLTVATADSVGSRHILQKKAKDESEEASDEETTESGDAKDAVKEKSTKEKEGAKSNSKAKSDDMTGEKGKGEDMTETDKKMKANTEAGAKGKAKGEAETEGEEDEGTVTVVENGSGKKGDSDSKNGKGGSKSASKKNEMSDDMDSKKETAEAENGAEDKGKDPKTKGDKGSTDRDAESSKASMNKDRKAGGKSNKGVEAEDEAETAEKDEAEGSADKGKGTDSVAKKSDKKQKANKVKKGKKGTVKVVEGENKEGESKKKAAPVVKKKERPTLPSDCVWDSDSKFCFVDREPFAKILSRARSKAGKVMLQEYECLELNQVACNRMEGCEWLGICRSSAYLKAQDKCFGSAVAFSYHIDGTCATHENQAACSLNDKCTWVSDREICAVDFIKALTGVSLDGQDVVNTRNARRGELQVAFNQNVVSFVQDPDSIKDEWVLPDFNCPNGVDADVCEFVEVFDTEFVLNAFCGQKYDINDISDCNLDESCEISADGACGISPAARQEEVVRQGTAVLSTLASSALGTQYIELVNACQAGPSNVEGEGCAPGCLLDEGTCIVDTDTFIQETVLTSKGFKSGQCKGFPLVLKDFGCEGLDAEPCQAANECKLDKDDACIPDERAIVLSGLLQLERQVASAVKAASTKCGSIKTAAKCEKPKVL